MCFSDIYALTHTARMRRRAELGLDKQRMTDSRDGESQSPVYISGLSAPCLVSESLSPRCLPRPSISSIQARPLPTPGPRHGDHIYQSPVR